MYSMQQTLEAFVFGESYEKKECCPCHEVAEKFNALISLERKYQSRNYLYGGASVPMRAIVVDETCREKMCDWCYRTVDFFKLSRESAYVAMSCLDRFLSTRDGSPFLMSNSLFQLACVTSLYISIKVLEPVELGIKMLIEVCRDSYSEKQILETERKILSAIRWAVNPPSPQAFVTLYTEMLPPCLSLTQRRNIEGLVQYQLELSLLSYNSTVRHKPSELGLASMLNAMCLVPGVTQSIQSMFFQSVREMSGCRNQGSGLELSMSLLWKFLEYGYDNTPDIDLNSAGHSHSSNKCDSRRSFQMVKSSNIIPPCVFSGR